MEDVEDVEVCDLRWRLSSSPPSLFPCWPCTPLMLAGQVGSTLRWLLQLLLPLVNISSPVFCRCFLLIVVPGDLKSVLCSDNIYVSGHLVLGERRRSVYTHSES